MKVNRDAVVHLDLEIKIITISSNCPFLNNITSHFHYPNVPWECVDGHRWITFSKLRPKHVISIKQLCVVESWINAGINECCNLFFTWRRRRSGFFGLWVARSTFKSISYCIPDPKITSILLPFEDRAMKTFG